MSADRWTVVVGGWPVVVWPLLAVLVAARHRRGGHRRPEPDATPEARDGGPTTGAASRSPIDAALVTIGTVVLRAVGRARRRPTSPVEESRARGAALALVVAVGALAVAPTMVPVVLAVAVGGPVVHERRRLQCHRQAITVDLPDVLDLLRLALDAGCTVPHALQAVAAHHHGALGDALRTTTVELAQRGNIDDALEGLLRREGEPVRPLCQSLLAAVRHGLPVAAVLDALGTEARAVRRRRAEAVARRLPVALLFPLVACTLPAFALLTVVPLLAGGLRSVRW